MLEIVNRQRKTKINRNVWREFAEQTVAVVEKARGKTLTIAFVSDAQMRELNREFRGKNATTDVLSFPFEADQFDFETSPHNLGDIAISVEQAERQARENNLSLELEIKQLILHGVLHLCGFDHAVDRGEMNARELELRDKLGIS